MSQIFEYTPFPFMWVAWVIFVSTFYLVIDQPGNFWFYWPESLSLLLHMPLLGLFWPQKKLFTTMAVIIGQLESHLFWIDFSHVELTGNPSAACKYLTFFTWKPAHKNYRLYLEGQDNQSKGYMCYNCPPCVWWELTITHFYLATLLVILIF